MIRKSGDRFSEKIMLKQKTLAPDSTQLNQALDRRIAVRDQTGLACDLDGAVAEHFNRITMLTGAIGEYCDDRAYGMITECLIDPVANREFRRHGESSSLHALPLIRFKCGCFAIDKTGYVALPTY